MMCAMPGIWYTGNSLSFPDGTANRGDSDPVSTSAPQKQRPHRVDPRRSHTELEHDTRCVRRVACSQQGSASSPSTLVRVGRTRAVPCGSVSSIGNYHAEPAETAAVSDVDICRGAPKRSCSYVQTDIDFPLRGALLRRAYHHTTRSRRIRRGVCHLHRCRSPRVLVKSLSFTVEGSSYWCP